MNIIEKKNVLKHWALYVFLRFIMGEMDFLSVSARLLASGGKAVKTVEYLMHQNVRVR